MGKMLRPEIALDSETANAIDEAIAQGQFADEAELIRHALLLWMDWQRDQDEGYQQIVDRFGIERLQQMVADGLASGEPIEGGFDVEDIKRRGMARLAERRSG